MANELVIQPSDIFQMTGVPQTAELERMLSVAFDFINYLKPGESLRTSSTIYSKVSDDLVHIHSYVQPRQCLDELENKKILRIPV